MIQRPSSPTAALPPAVAVERLSKRFGRAPSAPLALDDVSLTVGRGEIVSLLGANGAGKSTLVRILATLLRPTAGSARIAGIDVAAQPARARAAIGVALQDVGVDPGQRVWRLVRLHARLHGWARRASHERAREVLALLGLETVAERRVDTLSGGMRRRLDLALALVHAPPVLLLDEPTTGLDPASRRELWREIVELRTDGTTVLLTTQHLDEAERLADRVAILAAGRIVAEGTPSELKRRLSHTIFEATFRERHEAVAAAALLGPDAALTGAELRVPLADDPGAVTDALARLNAHGLSLASLAVTQPTLEDVFLATLGTQQDHDG